MDFAPLIAAAQEARTKAYAPYSQYAVGAAVLGKDGQIYSGANVENVSFGLCLCAERSALSAMIMNGCRDIQAIAVVTKDGGTPCGMCRQVIAEFATDPSNLHILCTDLSGTMEVHTLAELFPSGFRSDLQKTPL